MAEGFLRDRSSRFLDGALRVTSAGTWARGNQPPTPEAVAAAGKRGIDIEGNRSTTFLPELADRADLVVTMTEEHKEEVLDVAPEALAKTFTLKELVHLVDELPAADPEVSRASLLERIGAADRMRRHPDVMPTADVDVADPLGLSMEAYRATAWEIEGLIDRLVEGLAGKTAMAGSSAED